MERDDRPSGAAEVDAPFRTQYDLQSTEGLDDARIGQAEVSQITLGKHDGFYLINRRIKATFEHPFLVRRDEEWGFCFAELLQVGDYLITLVDGQLDEERIDALERIGGIVRTVALHVPGMNTYLADGVWIHNDADLKESSGPGPRISNSGPGISNSGGSTGFTISESVTASSSGSSSESKSSGSSFSSSESSVVISNTSGTISDSAAE